MSSTDEFEINMSNNTETQNLHTNNAKVTEAVNELKVQIQQLMTDIQQNKISISNFESLCQNVQPLKNTEYIELCKLQHELEVIRREHETIKNENAQCLERMNNLAYIVSDLNTKIKILEEEKASLVTSVRMLNEDYRQVILENNPPKECRKSISPLRVEKSPHISTEDPTHPRNKNASAADVTHDLPVITKIINHDKPTCTIESRSEESPVFHNHNGMMVTPRNIPNEGIVPDTSAQNIKDTNVHIHNPRLFTANCSEEKPTLREESNQLDATNRPPKNTVPCPFLQRRGHCIKGEKCDFSHLLKSFHKERRTPLAKPKHPTPCPFSKRNGFCLKDSSCDFFHETFRGQLYQPRHHSSISLVSPLRELKPTLDHLVSMLQKIKSNRMGHLQYQPSMEINRFALKTQNFPLQPLMNIPYPWP